MFDVCSRVVYSRCQLLPVSLHTLHQTLMPVHVGGQPTAQSSIWLCSLAKPNGMRPRDQTLIGLTQEGDHSVPILDKVLRLAWCCFIGVFDPTRGFYPRKHRHKALNLIKVMTLGR